MTQLDVHLKEYEVLKEEQRNRINYRDNLVYASLVATGSLGVSALTSQANNWQLLLAPYVLGILCWAYIINDYKVSHLGQYVRRSLTQRIATSLNSNVDELLQWEIYHRKHGLRRFQKTLQLLMDLFLFVLPAAAAILYSAKASYTEGWLRVAWFLDIAFCVASLLLIILHHDGSAES